MVKTTIRSIVLVLALCLGAGVASTFAQAVSQTNTIYAAQVFTASAQTGAVITLGQSPSGNGGSNSVGNVTVTGTALSTVTFSVLGSADGGNTFTALPINAIATPGTTATTATATSGGVYQVNLAGITQIEFQTSGTFTATSVNLILTTSPTGIIARNNSGGGSSGTVTNFVFSTPTLSPLFTCTVANSTTTPTLTCPQSNAAQNSVYAGPATGGPGAPSFQTAPTFSAANLTNFPASLVPAGGYYAGTATGAVNVLAVSLNTNLGTPTQAQLIGIPITFTPNLSNTTNAPTLNVNGLGAVAITKCSTTVLASGDIATTATAQVIYNGTNYQLQNPQIGACQNSSSGNWSVGGTATATAFSSAGVTSAVTFGNVSGSSASQAGATTVQGIPNSSTGGAGTLSLKAGASTGSGAQGFANIQQSFLVASALAATFEAVSMTTTADQVVASPTGSLTNVGIAQTVGGTNAQLFVVSHGKTTARFDGTPVIGDVACYPLSGGTAGLLHDNATTACTLGEAAGVITGQVSGTGSGSTATVEIK